jgi:hypothetical protein
MIVSSVAMGLGLGQWYPGEGVTGPASCGDNPCEFYDYLIVTDDCAAWLACANQPAVTFSNVLGQGASSITSGAASVVGSAVSGATSSASTDLLLIAGAAALIMAFLVFEKL